MAQRRLRLRSVRSLARRYGLVGARGIAVLCLLLVVGGALGGMAVLRQDNVEVVPRDELVADEEIAFAPEEEPAVEKADGREATERPPVVVVHVDGAVQSPGVYRVEGSSPRVYDAVQMAGGLAGDAETATVNLAQELADGQKVYIPHLGEEPQAGLETPVTPTEAAGSSLVNLNTAGLEELQTLPGVGEATASAIVDDRERNGAFASIEDLMRVSGIGQKKFDKLRELVCV